MATLGTVAAAVLLHSAGAGQQDSSFQQWAGRSLLPRGKFSHPSCTSIPSVQVVVATETSLAGSVRVDEFCHANSIAFIKVGGRAAGSSSLLQTKRMRCEPCLFSHTCVVHCTHPLSLSLPTPQADIRGVFAQVFCDFGPAFEVLDVDGALCCCCCC